MRYIGSEGGGIHGPPPARAGPARNDPDSADRRGAPCACLACAQSGARTAPALTPARARTGARRLRANKGRSTAGPERGMNTSRTRRTHALHRPRRRAVHPPGGLLPPLHGVRQCRRRRKPRTAIRGKAGRLFRTLRKADRMRPAGAALHRRAGAAHPHVVAAHRERRGADRARPAGAGLGCGGRQRLRLYHAPGAALPGGDRRAGRARRRNPRPALAGGA